MRPTTIANAAVGFGFSCVASFRWGVGGSDRVFFFLFLTVFYFIPLLRTWKVLIEINFSQRMGKEKFCPFLDWKHAFITMLNTKFMAKHNNIICTTRNGRLSTNIFIPTIFVFMFDMKITWFYYVSAMELSCRGTGTKIVVCLWFLVEQLFWPSIQYFSNRFNLAILVGVTHFEYSIQLLIFYAICLYMMKWSCNIGILRKTNSLWWNTL